MIATASNTVVATVQLGAFPDAVVFNNVSVIDTASNTVVGTPIPVGTNPDGVAVTPDGKHVYVTNTFSNNVSVIDTATNTVVATVPVGKVPGGVAIIPPPPGVPFLAFSAQLEIDLDRAPKEDRFELHSQFTLSSTERDGIHPRAEAVKLQVGTFTVTIPPGSFTKRKDGSFTFEGVIHGVSLEARIKPAGTLRYAFHAEAGDANLTGTKNDVQVSLIIGDDSGTTSVKAQISH